MAGYILAVPRSSSNLDTWSAGGGDFSVVGRAGSYASPVWLVKVSVKNDAYMHFSYSAQRGVESISLQREGVNADMAKTFFLVGDRGLLAGQ